jgi:hypothetical protein
MTLRSRQLEKTWISGTELSADTAYVTSGVGAPCTATVVRERAGVPRSRKDASKPRSLCPDSDILDFGDASS